jgi:hypothetical protein
MSDLGTATLCIGMSDRTRQNRFWAAAELYRRARSQGRRGRFSSALGRDSGRLFDLAEVEANCPVHGRFHAGVRSVPLEQIQGSEGRSHDFDRSFRPLQNHTKDRWVGIAVAHSRGRVLPLVDLIQVGDVFFVRDGHHRVSVAQALGQVAIDAEVTVWQVDGPLPWQAAACRNQQIGDDVGQLTAHLLSGFRALLSTLASSLRALPAPQTILGRA